MRPQHAGGHLCKGACCAPQRAKNKKWQLLDGGVEEEIEQKTDVGFDAPCRPVPHTTLK